MFDKEEEKRKSFILNTILLGNICLALIANFVNVFIHPPGQDPLSIILPGVFLLFTYMLYVTSKHISSRVAAVVLIWALSFIAYFLAYKWGTVIPNSWIILALTVVMGGILLSSKFSLFLIIVHFFVLFPLTYLQVVGIITYDQWDISPRLGSFVVKIIILSVVALISWLSNREIEKALKRAQGSEKALKKERDLLEVKIDERTKELKKTQLEKVLHLYHLADFGRMTAGLFHDLVNPLTTVSLNLEKLSQSNNSLTVQRAVLGTKRMNGFVQAVKKQIQKQEVKEVFSLNKEITQVTEVLAYKAKGAKVAVGKIGNQSIKTYGNSLRFNQLVTNLLSNAFDAYTGVRRQKNRTVIIGLSTKNGEITLTVQDFGSGIANRNIKKVFDPFFTTKSIERGTGIGLSICKDIVEKEFGGQTKVESKEGVGTTFTVKFPIRKASKKMI